MAEGGLSFHPSSSELRQVLRHQASCPAHLVRKTPKGPLSFPLGAGIQMVSVRKLIFWFQSEECQTCVLQVNLKLPYQCRHAHVLQKVQKPSAHLGMHFQYLPVTSAYRTIVSQGLWLYHIYPDYGYIIIYIPTYGGDRRGSDHLLLFPNPFPSQGLTDLGDAVPDFSNFTLPAAIELQLVEEGRP